MASRILLARHAHIGLSQPGRLVGATDVPLDDCGESQAHVLAARVSRMAPGRCFCSPMKRCRQTAMAIAASMPIHIDEDLREIDFGQWENRRFEEMAAEDAALVNRWAAFDMDFAFPGGERLGSFLDRVRAAADRIAGDSAETVLAVTHGGVVRAMICHWLGLRPEQYVLFDVGYAAMAVIKLHEGRGVLTALERVDMPEGPSHG